MTRLATWAFVAGLAAALAGCNRRGAPANSMPPKEVLFALTQAHERKDYDAFNRLVLAERCDGLVSTLRAVDDFLAAERRLRDVIRHSFGTEFADVIDLSRFEGHLGVFSTDVDLLDEQINGQHAIVTYMVAGMPPAHEAALVHVDGRWRYDPGEGFSPAWPRAFKKMAAVLDQMAGELKSGDRSTHEVYNDPQTFLHDLAKRLSAATADLPTSPLSESSPSSQPGGG